MAFLMEPKCSAPGRNQTIKYDRLISGFERLNCQDSKEMRPSKSVKTTYSKYCGEMAGN